VKNSKNNEKIYIYILLTLNVVLDKRNKKIFNLIVINFQYVTYNLKEIKIFWEIMTPCP